MSGATFVRNLASLTGLSFFALATMATMATIAVGCARASDDAGATEDAVTTAPKDCKGLDRSEIGACLVGQANAKLRKAIVTVNQELGARYAGPADAKESEDAVPYRIRTLESCFSFPNTRAVEIVWQQMANVVEFLGEFHRDRRGRGNRWFSDVLVCKASDLDNNSLIPGGGLWGGELRLEASSLQVGIKIPLRGDPQAQSSHELRDRWNKGEHFAATVYDDKQGIFREKVWPLINPVGIARVQAEPALASAITGLASTLKSIRGDADESSIRNRLINAVNANTAVDVKVDDTTNVTLGQAANQKIEKMDSAQMQQLIDRWSAFLDQEGLTDDGLEALGELHQKAAGRSCDVEIEQVCRLVAVNNAHCINIAVAVNVNQRLIGKYMVTTANQQAQTPNRVRAKQEAFICVQTNDFIEVKLDVSVEAAVNSAGLARALGTN